MGGRALHNTRTGNHGSAAGWVIMLFVASACMFILGVLVGRNTAPVHFNMEHLDEKLAQLQNSVLSRPGGEKSPSNDLPDQIFFEFYDRLKEKVDIDEHALGRPRVLAPKYPKPDPAEIRVQPPQTARPAEPVPARSHAEQPAPAPSEKLYAIQVASLRDSQNAETVKEKYRSKGYPAFTQTTVVEGRGRWCRVRIGPYTDRGQAESDLIRLQKAGVDAMLLPHEPGF
jgi:hypothetical protein